MTQSHHDLNKPGSGFTNGAVGFCQSCVTDGRKLFHSHRQRSEHPPVPSVCAPEFNDCHIWLRQSCCSASCSSGFTFLQPVLSSDFADVSAALYLQWLFFLFLLLSDTFAGHTWPPPFCCNHSFIGLSVFCLLLPVAYRSSRSLPLADISRTAA